MKKLLIILLSIFYIFNTNCNVFANDQEEETDYIWLYDEIKNTSANSTEEPVLNSRYVCCIERNSKEILYSKNENKKVPMASTTKIMTT